MLTPTEEQAVADIKSLIAQGPLQVNVGYHGNKTLYIFMPDHRRAFTFNMSERVYSNLLNWIGTFFETQVDKDRIAPDSGADAVIDEVNEVGT